MLSGCFTAETGGTASGRGYGYALATFGLTSPAQPARPPALASSSRPKPTVDPSAGAGPPRKAAAAAAAVESGGSGGNAGIGHGGQRPRGGAGGSGGGTCRPEWTRAHPSPTRRPYLPARRSPMAARRRWTRPRSSRRPWTPGRPPDAPVLNLTRGLVSRWKLDETDRQRHDGHDGDQPRHPQRRGPGRRRFSRRPVRQPGLAALRRGQRLRVARHDQPAREQPAPDRGLLVQRRGHAGRLPDLRVADRRAGGRLPAEAGLPRRPGGRLGRRRR